MGKFWALYPTEVWRVPDRDEVIETGLPRLEGLELSQLSGTFPAALEESLALLLERLADEADPLSSFNASI